MAGFENDVMYAKNGDFTQADNQSPSESNGLATNGQLWVGTTLVNAGGTHVNVGSLTSPNSSITVGFSSPNITLSVSGSSVGQTITGNTGGALSPTAGNWNILTANSTPKFAGSGSTLTQDFRLTNLLLGAAGSSITSATFNEGFGFDALAALTSSVANVAVGYNSLLSLTSGSGGNTAVGHVVLDNLVSGVGNTAVGSAALSALSGASTNNTALGANSLVNLGTGSTNIAIGLSSGTNYNAAESSNIIIGNAGTNAESNKIRIGTSGSGTGQQNATFIAGINGVNVGSVASVVSISGDQLGLTTITAGTGISVTPGANTITLAVTGSGLVWTVITADQTAAVNNGYICNKGSELLLTLPTTAVVGDIIRVTGINTALGWKIVQNANQQIFFGNASTTLGAAGFIQSSAIRDSIEIVCVVAGASTVYNVLSSVGNPTIS